MIFKIAVTAFVIFAFTFCLNFVFEGKWPKSTDKVNASIGGASLLVGIPLFLIAVLIELWS